MKMIRIFRTVSIVAAVLLPALSAADETPAKIGAYLAACVEAEQFNGSVLVARKDEQLVCRGFGFANFEHQALNSPETKFRLGSVTKQFTAMAVMVLAEQGKPSVDDPVGKHVEQAPEAWKEVTIHHLLSHTSGIANFTSFPDYLATMRLPSTPDQTIARFRDKPLEFAPGEKFAYSNSGYILLGTIIEKVSGQSYEAFLREAIFQPLEMLATGYDHQEEILEHRAAGYRRDAKLSNAPFIDMSIPYAAGGLYSTVGDLWRWDQALSAGKLLSQKGMEAMFTPAKGDYAYGWNIHKRSGQVVVSHGGGINGFATSIVRIPDLQVCVAVLSNVESSASGRMAHDLASIVLGEPYQSPKVRRVAQVDPKIYDELVGRYELAPTFILTVTRQGDRLLTQATGQSQVEVFPESESDFFLRVVDAQITFVRDKEGEITHLILHQGGRDMVAKRLAADRQPEKK